MLGFQEVETAGELNPKIEKEIRTAFAELLENNGHGSASVVAEFLSNLEGRTINVTDFSLYTIHGCPTTSIFTKPCALPLFLRVNLFESLRQGSDALASTELEKTRRLLDLNPAQVVASVLSDCRDSVKLKGLPLQKLTS